MKKVVVIGGGIAGLSAGIYARQCGFDVTILESHEIAGGNCTSWKRKGFLFEGGMHWLTGSAAHEPIHAIWRNIGALDDSVQVHYPEPFMEYNHEGEHVCVYRNVDRFEAHLLSLSPQDEKPIRAMCRQIRRVQNLAMPLTDIKGVKVTRKRYPPISMLFSAISATRLISSLSKVTRQQYIAQFSHEGIRQLLLCCTTDESGVMPIIFTMGTLTRGDGGFPEGGSLAFVNRIVKRFESLGGQISYGTRATRILTHEGKVTGVLCGAEEIEADSVIVTADTMAIESLFDTPPKAAWLEEMHSVTRPTMNVFVSLGVNAELSDLPHGYAFHARNSIDFGGRSCDYLTINNYADDPVYSPPGQSALTISLPGDTYDFWKTAKENGTYAAEKVKLANALIEELSEQIPAILGKVEMYDVATPLTYERYCGNWRGSWMSEMGGKASFNQYPCTIDGLSGVYFAGQRIMPPGGLPVAAMTGRSAVQHLCRETETLFINEEE